MPVHRNAPALLAALLTLLVGIVGCASDEAAPNESADTEYGAAVDAGTALPVQRVATDPAQFTEKTLVLEGRVSSVCEHKGCWLALDTGADTPPLRVEVARTDSDEYAFTVPTDASGWATVQGRLVAEEPPSHEDHGDGAEASADTEAPAPSYHMIADGVRLTASDG
ncbi:MAG: DUF4920 domain-containing protein [Longimonas sp.]|uniref:DUF4920 domain-containing protein n=1 Tax=Longimonas sp. TaxID=2039626 RepID=UPI003974C46C